MPLLIGIADDHLSFLQSMSLLIGSFPNMEIILQAHDGQDLLDKLSRSSTRPQICLVDVNMPVLDGPGTMLQLSRDYPEIKTLALSMQENDAALIRMLRAGCRGWWLKYFTPDELERAIREVHQSGFYNADPLNVYHRRQSNYINEGPIHLTEEERRLLQLSCSELPTDEIDKRLSLPDPQRHSLYNNLYEKLHVRSRLGIAMEGFRRGWVSDR